MAYTTEDLLGPASWLGQRVDSFRYDLLDGRLAKIGEVHPSVDSRPQIRANTESTVMRQLDGIEFVQGELQHIDVRSNRLRPVCVLQNGVEFELGVFMFGEHNTERSSRGDVWRPVLYDQALILDQPLERSISVQPGDDLQYLFDTVALEVGITDIIRDTNSTAASEAIVWPAGRSRFTVEEEITKRSGCLRPYFNAHGQLTCRMAPDPNTVTADTSYGDGRVDADTRVDTDDSYRAPNRYIVIGSGSEFPVVGVYDLPPDAPHSAANRGFVVSETIDTPGITDASTAYSSARAAAVMDTRSWQRASFSSPLDPRLDLYSVVDYYGVLYLEVGFTQELTSGGTHTHDLSRLWAS